MDGDPRRVLTVTALVVSLIVGVAPPMFYLWRELAALEAHMDGAVQIQSSTLSRFVNRNPGTWRYHESLLKELLAVHHAHSRDDRHEAVRIADPDGATIVGHAPLLRAPVVSHRAPLYDSGAVVAYVEESHSLRPLLLETALAAIAGLLLGFGVFTTFRRLPLRLVHRALTEAQDAARSAQHELEKRTVAEAVLAESGERLGHLLALSPAVIYAAKAHGDYGATFISPNVREQLGHAPEDFLGDPRFWAKRIHPEDRERVLAQQQQLYTDGRIRVEYRFRHSDGSWRWMDDVTVLVRDATGKALERVGSWFDVTERKAATEALQESENRLRAVIDSALDAIVVNDSEGCIVEFNPAAERIYGWTRGQVIGRRVDELLIPDSDGGQWRRDFRKGLQTGGAGFAGRRAEVHSLHAYGHEFPSEIALQCIERDGRLYFVAFLRDITEQKRAQEALRTSEARLRQLLASTPAVIWAGRAGGDYGATFVSENVRAQLGYAPEDFTGDPGFWANNIHPEDRERVFADLPALVARGRVEHEYRFRHADGSWRWMHDEATVVRDAQGLTEQIVGYWIDITPRVEAEQSLRRAQERIQLAVEGSGVALWDADAATGELYLSERWAEMRGAPSGPTHTTVQELLTLTHPEERQGLFEAALLVAKGVRAGYREEHRVRTVSGEWRWVLSQGKVTERDPASGRALRMSGTNLDITDRRKAQAALEAALRAKSEFMRNVTHELRTPLNSVIGFAELLKEEVPGSLNAKQAGFVADIHKSGLRLLKVVEGILEMSRLDAGEEELEREPVDIGAALNECVVAHREAAAERGVTMGMEVAPDTGSAEMDPKALRRILDALLGNAIKFNRGGGQVALRARRAGDWLEIAVADTGIGIARENLAKLFKPLVQFDSGLTREYGGIGMGLALARRLAERYGGTIEVESEPGKGSTFTLRLPIQEQV